MAQTDFFLGKRVGCGADFLRARTHFFGARTYFCGKKRLSRREDLLGRLDGYLGENRRRGVVGHQPVVTVF